MDGSEYRIRSNKERKRRLKEKAKNIFDVARKAFENGDLDEIRGKEATEVLIGLVV